MKKILSFSFLVLFFAAMMVSCDDDSSPNIDVAAINTTQESMAKEVPSVTLTQDEMILLTELSNGSPKLSQEQAMEIANNFLNKGTTSSLSKRGTAMPRCEVLTRAKQRISKSGTATDEVDTMLYVFNYDEGYAVIAADIRVPEQILAYSEIGEIHLNTDNPGLNLFVNMAQDYIDLCVSKAEFKKDSVESILNEKVFSVLGLKIDSKNVLSKSTTELYRHSYESGYYETFLNTSIVGPHIKTYWNQSSPYNDDIPTVNDSLCSAGCTPIAIAQLMVRWKWPLRYDNNKTIAWTSIKKAPSDYTAKDKKNIAVFVHKVGVAINTTYTPSHGSSARLQDGVAFLKKHGYHTSGVKNYSATEIRESLDKKRPVLIAGVTKMDEGMIGHSWLIDGYADVAYRYEKKTTCIVVTRDDATGEVKTDMNTFTSSTGTLHKYYHHFNMGWGENTIDNCNGYFLESTFELRNEYVIKTGQEPLYTPIGDEDNYKYNLIIATNIYH